MKYFLFVFLLPLGLYGQIPVDEIFLNKQAIPTNEPSIAIHPIESRYMFVGSNTNHYYTSEDGGLNWKYNELKSTLGVYGDPVVYITAAGEYYYVHLSKTPGKNHPEMFDRIVFQKSSDKGKTFNDGVGVGFNNGKMQDKPSMAVDEREKSPYKGRIYLAWTQFDRYKSEFKKDSTRIRFAFSTDGGLTFNDSAIVSDESGDCMDGDNTLEGATMAIGPKGEIYMVWAAKGKIYFDQSFDGGKTWGVDIVIEEQKDGWEHEVAYLMRANGMPFIKAGRKKELYIVWSDTRNGDLDVFMKISKDGGITWGPAIRVNNDEIGNGKAQFMPNIAVDQKDGSIYIAYYDKRHSESGMFMDVYISITKDGKKFKHARITNISFACPGTKVFFGDYLWIAAVNYDVRPAYTVYQEGVVTIKTALLNKPFLTKVNHSFKPTAISYFFDPKLEKLFLHVIMPPTGKYEIEISQRGNKVYYALSESPVPDGGDMELVIPTNKFKNGLYEVKITTRAGEIYMQVVIE